MANMATSRVARRVINKEHRARSAALLGVVGYPEAPLSRRRNLQRENGWCPAASGRLSKYRNDNLWPIYLFINGLNVVDLCTPYIRPEV